MEQGLKINHLGELLPPHVLFFPADLQTGSGFSLLRELLLLPIRSNLKKDFFELTVQGQSITVDKHGGGIMGHLVTWPWPSGNRGFWLELGFNYDP